MKKALTLITVLSLLISMQCFVFADDTDQSDDSVEEFREEIVQEQPTITKREATISMLLNAGWTEDEISEWYTEEDLAEMDENALAVSNNASYIRCQEGSEDEKLVTEEISRQQFEYEVNRADCGEEEHSDTELSNLSSNGVFELQPIYGWEDMDGETRNDRIYYGLDGHCGASIWNADSSCYLKQNMGLVWMGNDSYLVQYRFSWEKEPYYKLKDYFAVAPATDMIVHENPRMKMTFKYNLDGDKTETLQDGTNTHFTVSNLSMGQGRQVEIIWPYKIIYMTNGNPAKNLKGYFTYYARLNNKYTYEQYIVYAQYYHGKMVLDSSLSISVSIDGPSASFSISPNIGFTAETHSMDVKAKNIYK